MSPLRAYIEAALDTYLFEDYSPQIQEGFDLGVLRSLKDLPQIMAYAERVLGKTKIGQEQGRVVYRLGAGKCLKVARNVDGIAQNEAEITVCRSPESQDIFPRILDSDSQGMWLVAEEAVPMSSVEFKNLTGISWSKFVFAIGGVFPKTLSATTDGQIRQYQAAFDKHYTNRFFRRVVNSVKNCGYEPSNLVKLDSWGITRGMPVIVNPGKSK
jgi:hypothetical protein